MTINCSGQAPHGVSLAASHEGLTEKAQRYTVAPPSLYPDDVGRASIPDEQSLRVNDGTLPELTTWDHADIPDIEWAWDGWLPKGLLTMICGEPAAGKSALAMHIARCVVTGSEWPDGTLPDETGTVLWCETEAGQAINYQRANEWGGNSLLQGLASPYGDLFTEVRLDRSDHLKRVSELARDPRIKLVVIDSLSGSHRIDENTTAASTILQSLARVARDTSKPIIVTHHLRKRSNRDVGIIALDRIRGSSALTQYTRMVWAVDTPNPTTPTEKRLAVIKNNMYGSPEPFGFQISEDGIQFSFDPPCELQRVSAYDTAVSFLLTRLGDGQHVPAREMQEMREQEGISPRTLTRARENIGVCSKREDGHWYWYIPMRNDN